MEFFTRLFDTSGFPPRWDCGTWSATHGWIHIVADVAIFGAYMAIPLLIAFVALKRPDWGFPRILWLFVTFILACGTTHLIEAIIFWYPIYRIAAVAKVVTAIVSWATVLVLIHYAPRIVRLPGVTEINLKLDTEVTQRRTAQRKLREQAQVLQLALEAGEVGTWRRDLRTNLEERDAIANRILGLPGKPSVQPVEDFLNRVHPDDRALARRVLGEQRTSDAAYSVEFRIVRPDGSTHSIRDRGRRMAGEQGEATLLTGAMVDITDVVRAEEEQARLAAIVRATPDAVLSYGLDGNVLDWNGGAERIFGYTAEQAVGRPISLIVPEERADEMEHQLAAAGRGETIPHVETVRRTRDGTLVNVWQAVSPILDRGGNVTGLCSIERDITERTRQDRLLRRLNRQLSAKHDELERFVYLVSHDLKSPLVTITGFVDLLREDLAEVSHQARDDLNRIVEATHRMQERVDALLELSRAGRLQSPVEPIRLAEVVEQLGRELADSIDAAGAELVVEDTADHALLADRVRIRQALRHLLSNALRYGCDPPHSRITVGSEVHPEEVRVYVRDRGRGIAPEHQERVFQLFTRIELGGAGAGVGLAVVTQIMRAHGGRAWIESAVGEGATFWLAFPRQTGGDATSDGDTASWEQ